MSDSKSLNDIRLGIHRDARMVKNLEGPRLRYLFRLLTIRCRATMSRRYRSLNMLHRMFCRSTMRRCGRWRRALRRLTKT